MTRISAQKQSEKKTRPVETSAEEGETLRTGKETAVLLGVTPHWLRKLAQRGVLPRQGSKYPWPAVRRSFNDYLQTKGEQGSVPDEWRRERAQLVRVQRKLAELDLAKKRGEQVPLSAFRNTLGDLCSRFDAKIQALPRKWAPDLLSIEDMAVMVDKLEDLKEELRAEIRVSYDD